MREPDLDQQGRDFTNRLKANIKANLKSHDLASAFTINIGTISIIDSRAQRLDIGAGGLTGPERDSGG
jgi:hypothetical protein